MQHLVESALDTALVHSPLQRAFHWRAAKHLTVLAYHGVDDAEQFRQHLIYLRSYMHPIGLPEVVASIHGTRRLPNHAVLVTFDDGERSVFEIAAPLLAEMGIPAVVFIVAGVIDTEKPFWWTETEALLQAGAQSEKLPSGSWQELNRWMKTIPETQKQILIDELRQSVKPLPAFAPQLRAVELRQLESLGIAIGNHTVTHPCLNQCTDKLLRDEIITAHNRLSNLLGHAPDSFAYPNGNYDARARAVLEGLGYQIAFLFDHRPNPFPTTDQYRISRLRVNSYTDMNRFRLIISGVHPTLHQLRRRT